MSEAFKGAGGTDGGVGIFLIGLCLAVAGGYLLTSQVSVSTGSWLLYGHNAFGLSLIPFMLGLGLLFFNAKSVIGSLLTLAGLVIIIAGVLMNLRIYFEATSLFNTLLMLGMLAAGLGLIARSVRPYMQAEKESR
jgi:uncharacterized protein